MSDMSAGGRQFRAPRNDAEARQYVYDNFGFMANFLNDPELGPLLMQAGYEDWDPRLVEARIKNTNWWRTRSAAQRQYAQLEAEDPAELTRQLSVKSGALRNFGAKLGLQGFDYDKLAKDALQNGFSDEEIQDMLAGSISMETAHAPGQVSTWYNQTKSLGAQYYVGVSDEQALQWARQVARGELDPKDLEGQFRDQAKAKWAYLAPMIDAGTTVAQYFDPIKQEIAKTLEKTPDQIDLMNDAKYSQVIQTVDPQSGQERAMTVAEAGRWARNQSDWTKTDGFKKETANVTSTLAKAFGVG